MTLGLSVQYGMLKILFMARNERFNRFVRDFVDEAGTLAVGIADKEAERVDEEIFYYTSESDLKLPDNELVAILSESNPDWFD